MSAEADAADRLADAQKRLPVSQSTVQARSESSATPVPEVGRVVNRVFHAFDAKELERPT